MSDHVTDVRDTILSFLASVYELCGDGKEDTDLDVIFDHIDDLLIAGEFARVECVLALVDVTRLSTDAMVGFLSITLAAKSKLPYRRAFVAMVRAALADLPGKGGLLKGLE